MQLKICRSCKKEKSTNLFYKNKHTLDGLNSQCKECRSAIDRVNNKKDRIKHRLLRNLKNKIWMQKDRKKSPERYLLCAAKCRAKKHGLSFDLTIEDIKIPALCPILKIPLVIGTGYQDKNSPTLDRIDNKKGYTKDNVMVVSWRANSLKSDATIEEIIQIANFYKDFI